MDGYTVHVQLTVVKHAAYADTNRVVEQQRPQMLSHAVVQDPGVEEDPAHPEAPSLGIQRGVGAHYHRFTDFRASAVQDVGVSGTMPRLHFCCR